MVNFKINHIDGSVTLFPNRQKCAVVKSASQSAVLMGEDVIQMTIESAEPLTFNVGDKIDVYGNTYTLNQLPSITKTASNNLSYSLIFESIMYELNDVQFLLPINTINESLTGDLSDFIEVIILNTDRVYNEGVWIAGSIPDTETKTLNYDGENCLSVLQKLCTEFNVEFRITQDQNGVRTITIEEQVGEVFPITFAYGRTGGLYDIKRENVDSKNIVTRLFAFGSGDNLGDSYRYSKLCLPDKSRSESYIDDDEMMSVYGVRENIKTFDDIKPQFNGAITSVVADPNLKKWKFIDTSINFDLNEKQNGSTKWLIAGTSAKIHFNTGNLAGYDFELVSYDHATKTVEIRQFEDENGYLFPSPTSSAFRFAVGDSYFFKDIRLPDAYIEAAEEELQTKAEEYLSEYAQPHVQYGLTLDPMFVKSLVNSAGTATIFACGDYVTVNDSDLNIVNKSIRVTGFSRDLLKDYDYNLTLGDSVTQTTISRIIGDLRQVNDIIAVNDLADTSRTRRNHMTVEELKSMIFDTEGDYYSEKIKPLSIETTMLSVGAKSQQMELRNVVFEPNYQSDVNTFFASAGYVEHYAIADTIKTWLLSSSTFSDLLPLSAYYVFAKCEKNGNGGVWVVSTEKYTVDEDPNYYYFMVGVLSSVLSGDGRNSARTLSATYGSTTVNGRFITTGVLKSNNGKVKFDLDNGTIEAEDGITFGVGAEKQTLKDYATTTDSKIVSTNSKIANMTIGGVNMLPHTKLDSLDYLYNYISGYKYNATLVDDDTFGKAIQFSETNGASIGTFKLKADTEYTFSWWAKCDSRRKDDNQCAMLRLLFGSIDLSKDYLCDLGAKIGRRGITIISQDSNPRVTTEKGHIMPTDMNWHRYWTVFKINDTVAAETLSIRLGIMAHTPDQGSKARFARIQLEEGNVPTDWTCAPEDVDEALATANDNASSALATAESAEGKIDNLQAGGRNYLINSASKSVWIKNGYYSCDRGTTWQAITGGVTMNHTISSNLNYTELEGKYLCYSWLQQGVENPNACAYISGISAGMRERFGGHCTAVWSKSGASNKTTNPCQNFEWADKNGRKYASSCLTPPEEGYHLASLTCNVQVFVYPTTDGEIWKLDYPLLEMSSKASAWTEAPEDIQSRIDTANTNASQAKASAEATEEALSQVDDDGYFSKIEKRAMQPQWLAIYGNATTTEGWSSNGSAYNVYNNAISAGFASTDAIVKAQFDAVIALRDYLNAVGLYTDANFPFNSTYTRANLSTLFQNYHKAEVALTEATASKYSDVQVANVKTGGANLLSGTANRAQTDVTYPSSGYSEGLQISTDIIPTETEYTASFDAKSTQNGDRVHCYFHSDNLTIDKVKVNGGNYVTTSADGMVIITLTSSWKRYNITWHQSSVPTKVKYVLVCRRFASYGKGSVSVKQLKLEVGNKATDWSPSNADVSSGISNAESNAKSYADTQVNGIVIGGRNLFLQSSGSTASTMTALNVTGVTTALSVEGGAVKSVQTAKGGFYITASRWAETWSGNQPWVLSMWVKGSVASQVVFGLEGKRTTTTNITTGWTRITLYGNTAYGTLICYPQSAGTFYFKKWQLEIGTKITDWTCAPEDIDNAIEDAKQEGVTAQEMANALDYLTTALKEAETGTKEQGFSVEIKGGVVLGNVIEAKNTSGTATAGVSGLQNNGDESVAFFAGAPMNSDSLPFYVTHGGKVVMRKAVITSGSATGSQVAITTADGGEVGAIMVGAIGGTDTQILGKKSGGIAKMLELAGLGATASTGTANAVSSSSLSANASGNATYTCTGHVTNPSSPSPTIEVTQAVSSVSSASHTLVSNPSKSGVLTLGVFACTFGSPTEPSLSGTGEFASSANNAWTISCFVSFEIYVGSNTTPILRKTFSRAVSKKNGNYSYSGDASYSTSGDKIVFGKNESVVLKVSCYALKGCSSRVTIPQQQSVLTASGGGSMSISYSMATTSGNILYQILNNTIYNDGMIMSKASNRYLALSPTTEDKIAEMRLGNFSAVMSSSGFGSYLRTASAIDTSKICPHLGVLFSGSLSPVSTSSTSVTINRFSGALTSGYSASRNTSSSAYYKITFNYGVTLPIVPLVFASIADNYTSSGAYAFEAHVRKITASYCEIFLSRDSSTNFTASFYINILTF